MFGAFKVMFSPVTNLSDARYAAALGSDIVGFSLNPSDSNYVPAATVKGMAQWLSGPALMAELAPNQGWKEAQDVLDILEMDLVLIRPDQAEEMNVHHIPFVLLVNNEDFIAVFDRLFLWEYCQALIIEKDHFETCVCVGAHNHLKIYVQLPTLSEGIIRWLLKHKPEGIVLSGEREDKPGYRDFESVNDFFDQLEAGSENASSDSA